MKINQFAIVPTALADRVSQLRTLRFLPDDWEALPVNQLFARLLGATQVNQDPASRAHFLAGLAATPTQSVQEWLASDQPLTTAVFDLVALQLLHFTAGVDYQPEEPIAAVEKLNLPLQPPAQWDQAGLVSAFYSLLVSRNHDGYRYLDQLAVDGVLAWTYDLPASQKPLFFNGQPVASFDPARFIREVVYVESDLDTDSDGMADLVKVEVIRPADSAAGLRVPAVFTASPYNQGTNDAWGERLTHPVNHPIIHKRATAAAPAEPVLPAPKHHHPVSGEAAQASETFSETPSYTLNDYLAARGYAIVYAAGIGTKDSDGLQTCGSPEQVASMKAVVEWLHGDRRAFTTRTGGQTIRARWCNGKVAMTGRSYLGTLATAVATTGVAGLATIVSEAAISSWYDYYRENGLVMAPGGFQGEDADVLAAETFSRTANLADFLKVKDHNAAYLKAIAAAQDRQSGNYNPFWARRNYRPQIERIKCPVIMVHGLNDDNVKPNQVKALYDGLQAAGISNKLILHQGKHIYINAFPSLDFAEMINLWFAHFLWGVENGAEILLPPVLVQDNRQADHWLTADRWDGTQTTTYRLASGRLTTGQGEETTTFFFDGQPGGRYQAWCRDPQQWQAALLRDEGHFSAHFLTAPISREITLKGTPILYARVKVDADHGLLSAFLVDRGSARRLTVSPVVSGPRQLRAGFHFGCDDRREFALEKTASAAKVISFGHCNLQNRHDPATVDELAANQFVDLSIPLQPVYHHLVAGHQLELIVFATDYLMTLRGNEPLTYTLDLAACQLTIPHD